MKGRIKGTLVYFSLLGQCIEFHSNMGKIQTSHLPISIFLTTTNAADFLCYMKYLFTSTFDMCAQTSVFPGVSKADMIANVPDLNDGISLGMWH